MRIISWNVNGLRACIKKGLIEFIKEEEADIYCLQETKISELDLQKILPFFPIETYQPISLSAEKKGYSGVIVFTRKKPVNIETGIGSEKFDKEGRVITIEYNNFYLINSYFPNSQRKLARLDYKLEFNEKIFKKCGILSKKKPVIITGDFNVAHKEIDLKNPKQNETNAGFTVEERESFDGFIKSGYIDTFREFEKGEGHYTWWSYMFNARQKDIGWRIDYFIVDTSLKKKLINSSILKNVTGSDHCPINLEIKL